MDGVFDCQILNYLSFNCTNDIHEDLIDFNMQLIHYTKTGLCLSGFVLLFGTLVGHLKRGMNA